MVTSTNTVTVNGERLWSRLMEMAQFGALPEGGCNRQALTDEDQAGRSCFMDWCRDIGCEVRIDQIGNIFARRAGLDESLTPVMTGSHLDTQPTGGKFDGIYGVLAGLEVLHTLSENNIKTARSLEVVVWTNEEGCRFDTAMMGSAVWSGAMPLQDAYDLRDRDCFTVQQELTRIGHLGEHPAQCYKVHAALETHIEQGPVLEAENKVIGIVTGVQHMSRHRVIVQGQETHAGPTPMNMRFDPMMALSRFLPRLYAMAEQHAPDGRLTFGYINAAPGSSNTVPGELEVTVDIRHPEQKQYVEMLAGYKEIVEEACAHYQLPVELSCFWEAPGVQFADRCVNAVRNAAMANSYPSRELVSGAGHDACNLSRVAPTGMIFIPCEGGVSHNQKENALPEHITAGANILLGAMLALAEE
ncbi:MAG: Zn-dependent hydrolase [Proteobacteria bacterium]|nr:Zn-dependent hydrolase [Pseudomonadota bacterium]